MLRHVRSLRENEILARPRSIVQENKPGDMGAGERKNDPFFKRRFNGGI